MFSFHKPKVYRSSKGCCICKAKSSSSRFTDSKKYEPEFETCFQIHEKRSGEICNACVLLVKRWKKLPSNNGKNWHHMVDARAGPGTKSIMKYKSKSKINKRSAKKIRAKTRPPKNSGALSDDVSVGEECLSDQSSFGGVSRSNSMVPSPVSSEGSDDSIAIPPVQPKPYRRQRTSNPQKVSSFLDMNFWKKEKICCGIIFKGPTGEVLIDYRYIKPCRLCKKPSRDSEVSENDNLNQLNNNNIINGDKSSPLIGQQLPSLRNQEIIQQTNH